MSNPFAIRVVLTTDDDVTHSRDYVQPSDMAVSRWAFASFALGDMLALITSGTTDSLDFDEHEDGWRSEGYQAYVRPAITHWSVDVI